MNLNPKDEFDLTLEVLGSRKNKHQKGKWSYRKKGNHTEKYCMKKTIDQMVKLLEQHNIALPQGARNTDSREITEDHDERCHAVEACC